jgi:hypothetical protein
MYHMSSLKKRMISIRKQGSTRVHRNKTKNHTTLSERFQNIMLRSHVHPMRIEFELRVKKKSSIIVKS